MVMVEERKAYLVAGPILLDVRLAAPILGTSPNQRSRHRFFDAMDSRDFGVFVDFLASLRKVVFLPVTRMRVSRARDGLEGQGGEGELSYSLSCTADN